MKAVAKHIKLTFQGKEELWKVFWFWGILPNISIFYIVGHIKQTIYYPQENSLLKQILDKYFFELPMWGVFLYLLPSMILVLLNSHNSKSKGFRRIVIGISLLTLISASLLLIFFLFWIEAWKRNQGL